MINQTELRQRLREILAQASSSEEAARRIADELLNGNANHHLMVVFEEAAPTHQIRRARLMVKERRAVEARAIRGMMPRRRERVREVLEHYLRTCQTKEKATKEIRQAFEPEEDHLSLRIWLWGTIYRSARATFNFNDHFEPLEVRAEVFLNRNRRV